LTTRDDHGPAPAAPGCAPGAVTPGAVTATGTVTAGAAAVESWACAILARAGLTAADAAVVAGSLLFADRRGVSTHGVARVPLYLRRLSAGGIAPGARPVIVAEAGALCVMDGQGAAGAVTGVQAVQQTAARARRHGAGVTLVRGGNDFGSAGYYAALLAAGGCVGVAACNSDAVMCAPGGAGPVLGTNPLAFAVPGTTLLLDMATSAAAHGKIAHAAAEGSAIPTGWGVDASGQDTTDPRRVLDGGCVLPAAGPKGFGLALLVDVMAILAGARPSPCIPDVAAEPGLPQNLGMLFLAIYPGHCPDGPAFPAGVAGLLDAVHATGVAGGPPVMVPGEPEAAYGARLGGRIRLPGHLLAELVRVGREMGVPFPGPGGPEPAGSSEEAP
jgi:LDH2 family malate/lactate/ureidoglycolate dehydrogenase